MIRCGRTLPTASSSSSGKAELTSICGLSLLKASEITSRYTRGSLAIMHVSCRLVLLDTGKSDNYRDKALPQHIEIPLYTVLYRHYCCQRCCHLVPGGSQVV